MMLRRTTLTPFRQGAVRLVCRVNDKAETTGFWCRRCSSSTRCAPDQTTTHDPPRPTRTPQNPSETARTTQNPPQTTNLQPQTAKARVAPKDCNPGFALGCGLGDCKGSMSKPVKGDFLRECCLEGLTVALWPPSRELTLALAVLGPVQKHCEEQC